MSTPNVAELKRTLKAKPFIIINVDPEDEQK